MFFRTAKPAIQSLLKTATSTAVKASVSQAQRRLQSAAPYVVAPGYDQENYLGVHPKVTTNVKNANYSSLWRNVSKSDVELITFKAFLLRELGDYIGKTLLPSQGDTKNALTHTLASLEAAETREDLIKVIKQTPLLNDHLAIHFGGSIKNWDSLKKEYNHTQEFYCRQSRLGC